MTIPMRIRQSYTEIDEFIELLDEKNRNKIPKELREIFKKEKDTNYITNINANIPIKDQNLKEETLALIALLNLKFLCEDENEKKRLKNIYATNEIKYQKELREKYNPDNIFKNNKKEEIIEETMELVEIKPSFFKKIFDKIKSFFNR